MILYIYSREMELLGVVEAISSLIWTRNYSSCGVFKLLCPATKEHVALLAPGNLAMRYGDSEAAQIQDVFIRRDAEGMETLECHGKFLIRWLGQRVITQGLTISDAYPAILEQLVYENAVAPGNTLRVIPGLEIESSQAVRDSVDYTAKPYQNLQTALEEGAKAALLGIRVKTDPLGRTHAFQVYDGVDRRRGNPAGNKPCLFSIQMDNVLSQEYTRALEGRRTTAYIEGAQDENEIIPLELVGDEISGLDRHEMYVSASGVKWSYEEEDGTEVALTEDEYRSLLIQRGVDELAQAKEVLNFESEISPQGNLIYRQDFDLGDRVTCQDEAWGLTVDVRITQVVETYQPGAVEIRVVLGEGAPTLLEQVRRVAKELL